MYVWFRILTPFCPKFGLFATSGSSETYLCLAKCNFGIVLFVRPFALSMYGFLMFPMANWPQNLRYCIFDLHFAQKWPFFATSRASETYLYLAKCIFVMVLFVRLFVLSIYAFLMLQMTNWPQNLWFYIFDPHFT